MKVTILHLQTIIWISSGSKRKLTGSMPAMQMPDLKTGLIHWEAKHDKLGPFDGAAFEDVHAAMGGVTTAGVAVRGSTKKGKGGYG